MKIIQSWVFSFITVFIFNTSTSAQNLPPIRILLIGDSTLAPKNGYGDEFCKRLKKEVDCINLARNGRSSGSYIAEGLWQKALELMKNAPKVSQTYVLIEFAHNDQPGKPGRSTDLKTEFPANLKRYITETQSLGGFPILSTPLSRRQFNNDQLVRDLDEWAWVTKRVASEQNVPLMDLLSASSEAVQQMGQVEADTLAVEPQGGKNGAFDRTHIGMKGALLFSEMQASLFKKNIPTLQPYFYGEEHRPQLSEKDAQLYSIDKVLGYVGRPGQEKWSPWQPTLEKATQVDFIVDANEPSDGVRHFQTIQSAINALVKSNKMTHSKRRIFIEIHPGKYEGLVYVPALDAPVSLIGTGDSAEKTVISANLDASITGEEYAKLYESTFKQAHPSIQAMFDLVKSRSVITTFGSATLWTQNTGFQMSNLTVENRYVRQPQDCSAQCNPSAPAVMHQAVALMVDGADESLFDHVRLLALQDTLYLNNKPDRVTSRSYFVNSFIAGDVDFIFGDATAYFSDSEIKSVGDRKDSYVTAPSTHVHSRYGFVFDHCQFTSDSTPNAIAGNYHLARQWFHNQKCTPYAPMAVNHYSCVLGELDQYLEPVGTITLDTLQNVGKVVIINSMIGQHIHASHPWSDWNQPGKLSYRPAQYSKNNYIEYLKAIQSPGHQKPIDVFKADEIPWFLAEFNNQTTLMQISH
jgi:pectinesterase